MPHILGFVVVVVVSQDLLADWGLGPASMRAIEDACSGVRAIAPMLDAILSTTKDREECLLRARANSLAKQMELSEAEARDAATAIHDVSPLITIAEWEGSILPGGVWPPEKVQAPRLIRKAVLDVMPPDEKRVFAAIWCTSKLYGNEDAKKKGPAKLRNSHAGSAKQVLKEAEEIFGRDALMDKSALTRLMKKCVGFAPTKRGKPKHVPDAVTTAVLDYCRMLTAYGIPVFKSTVLGTFRRLVDGTPMGDKFKGDGSRAGGAGTGGGGGADGGGAGGGGAGGGGGDALWNENALENWYTRRFLGDHKEEVTTGLQLTIEVARSNWCTPANLNTFYETTKAQLIEVKYFEVITIVYINS